MCCMNAPVFRITCGALRRAIGFHQPHPATYSCGLLCSFAKSSVRQGIITGRMASHQANSHKRSDVARELKERLVWVDLEMTGLDINKHHILEMACLITDGDLNLVAEGRNIIIHQPDEVLNNMNNWCVEHHRESGLTEAVKASKVSLQMAEYEMLSYVREHTAPGFCPLAGNSVHADKVFLEKYMPQFMKHLHYRIVDVSTIKELCRRWYPEDFKAAPDKRAAHRALDDIKESIKELKFYRNAIFK